MTLIARFPDWMYTGLRLQEPNLPIDIDVSTIIPVIDITQGGRAYSLFTAEETIHEQSLPSTDIVIVPGDPDLHQYVWYAQLFNNAATAWVNATFFLREIAGTARVINLSTQTVPVGAARLHQFLVEGVTGFLPGRYLFFIPPGFELVLSFLITAVGDQRISTLVLEKIPRGFNPGI